MSARVKWRQAKAKPAKREALKMGCSPPGAGGCDMRLIPHCAPALSELCLRAPPRYATKCSIHERLPVQYQTVASSCASSAQEQDFRRGKTPPRSDDANGEGKYSFQIKNNKCVQSLDIKQQNKASRQQSGDNTRMLYQRISVALLAQTGCLFASV